MANKKYVNNFQDLLKFINNTFDTQFDTKKSSFRQGYIQFTGEKYGFTVATVSGMFNELIKCGVPLKVNQSLRSGTGFMLEFLDSFSLNSVKEDSVENSIEDVIKTTKDNLDKILPLETDEESLDSIQEVFDKALEQIPVEHLPPEYTKEEQSLEDCLAEANTLYDAKDKRGSKAALEKYARDFNIELNRGLTFENMMKEFEEALIIKFSVEG